MSITSDGAASPNDILVWLDGFWCFREEHSLDFLRDDGYRVILQHSKEWPGYIPL